jgi:glutamate-1-semialdehyde 2,1-aminomutase
MLLERGIYLGPSGYEVGFVSAAHSNDDIATTIEKMKESLSLIASSKS